MIVLIAGSRGVEGDLDRLFEAGLSQLRYIMPSVENHEITVLQGGARGVDHAGFIWAKERGMQVLTMKADWGQFGKRAGYLRNVEMRDVANCAIIVWDGDSPGTVHMINLMEASDKPYVLINVGRQT